jgi:hypothetical protein
MANINFKFLADSTQLKTASKDARTALNSIDGAAKKAGNALRAAFAVTGLSIGINGIVTGLKQAAQAAVDDTAAQAVLAASIRNVMDVTDDQIKSTEDFISALQLKTSILDDELRPAFSTIIRSTKDLAVSQRLLTIATDVSAGSGKDLGMVTQAIAKAYNGQFTSLNKLIAGLDKAKDPIGELERRFKGLGEVATQNNPLAQLSVIFNDIQEQLGSAVLPYLREFATYLASPEGQRQTQRVVQAFSEMITELGKVLQLLAANARNIAALVTTVGALRLAWGTVSLAVSAYAFVVKGATIATQGLKAALVSTGVGALVVLLGSLVGTFMSVDEQTQDATNSLDGYADAINEVADAYGRLPVTNTTDRSTTTPLNPKPGEIYTWYDLSEQKRTGIAVWYQQTWTGKTWTKPKKMTYSASTSTQSGTGNNSVIQAELDRLNNAAEKIRDAGKRFRDSFNLSSGLNDEGDVFNVETALAKVRKIVQAAKKVPALLKQLKAKGASPAMLTEIFGLGPIGAQATASALLTSGNLGEFIKAEQALTIAGQNAGVIAGQTTGDASYSININKANMTAEEIIKVIQAYEKKTGRKVSF